MAEEKRGGIYYPDLRCRAPRPWTVWQASVAHDAPQWKVLSTYVETMVKSTMQACALKTQEEAAHTTIGPLWPSRRPDPCAECVDFWWYGKSEDRSQLARPWLVPEHPVLTPQCHQVTGCRSEDMPVHFCYREVDRYRRVLDNMPEEAEERARVDEVNRFFGGMHYMYDDVDKSDADPQWKDHAHTMTLFHAFCSHRELDWRRATEGGMLFRRCMPAWVLAWVVTMYHENWDAWRWLCALPVPDIVHAQPSYVQTVARPVTCTALLSMHTFAEVLMEGIQLAREPVARRMVADIRARWPVVWSMWRGLQLVSLPSIHMWLYEALWWEEPKQGDYATFRSMVSACDEPHDDDDHEVVRDWLPDLPPVLYDNEKPDVNTLVRVARTGDWPRCQAVMTLFRDPACPQDRDPWETAWLPMLYGAATTLWRWRLTATGTDIQPVIYRGRWREGVGEGGSLLTEPPAGQGDGSFYVTLPGLDTRDDIQEAWRDRQWRVTSVVQQLWPRVERMCARLQWWTPIPVCRVNFEGCYGLLRRKRGRYGTRQCHSCVKMDNDPSALRRILREDHPHISPDLTTLLVAFTCAREDPRAMDAYGAWRQDRANRAFMRSTHPKKQKKKNRR